jgi:hypothetical protein
MRINNQNVSNYRKQNFCGIAQFARDLGVTRRLVDEGRELGSAATLDNHLYFLWNNAHADTSEVLGFLGTLGRPFKFHPDDLSVCDAQMKFKELG